MQTRLAWLLAILPAAPLCAQEGDHAQGAMPNPKTEAHAALKQWVGTWKMQGEMPAMPGVPGMEKPSQVKGTESASLICNGLWLKWESEAISGGKRSTGLWLVGYDPYKKQYVSYVVSSDEHCKGLVLLTGQYDKKSATWTWVGSTPEGKMKSVCRFDGKDKLTETLYSIDAEGKETEFMTMHRVRAKTRPKVSLMQASLKQARKNPVAVAHPAVLADVGSWVAETETSMGPQTIKAKATEKVMPICAGRWTWSEFASDFMGQAFTGHSVMGWDADKKRYACLWIDSMTATPTLTSGSYDKKTKTWSLNGTGTGPDGKSMKVSQKMSTTGEDSRMLKMSFESPMGESRMKISYRRSKD